MSKNLHNTNSFRKALRHGAQQGFGPFRQRPKKLDHITLPPKSPAPGDLQKKELPGVTNTEQLKQTQQDT